MAVRVLVLGGTGEARSIAARLAAQPGVEVISSLAGRVGSRRLPDGEVRIGGFSGPDGLAGWLRTERISAVIDATHPFARRITASAVRACEETGVPGLVLRRPGWQHAPGDDWHWVDSIESAASLVPSLGRRVFLSTGRQEVSAFAGSAGSWFLLRAIEPPDPPVPASLHVVLDRGPYTVDGELALLRGHRIDVLVTRDSGGDQTAAKLVAARQLRIPVVMIARPPLPVGVRAVASVDDAVAWLHELRTVG